MLIADATVVELVERLTVVVLLAKDVIELVSEVLNGAVVVAAALELLVDVEFVGDAEGDVLFSAVLTEAAAAAEEDMLEMPVGALEIIDMCGGVLLLDGWILRSADVVLSLFIKQMC